MRKTQLSDIKGYNFANGMDLRKPNAWVSQLPSPEEDINEQNLELFFYLIRERQDIWYRRIIQRLSAPWTKDPILRDYKFTNVYRELDRASQFLIKNILIQEMPLEEKLFKMMTFRFYNQPDSFRQNGGLIDLPSYENWNAKKIWHQTVAQRQRANPWHTAYMMNMAFAPKLSGQWKNPGLYKDWAYTNIVFDKLHSHILFIINKLDARNPFDLIEVLEQIDAVSTFQSYEFYIDFTYFEKYAPEGKIMHFDANDFVNVGPGASLGLRLIFPSLSPNQQKEGIYLLHKMADDMLGQNFKYPVWSKVTQDYSVTNQFDRKNFTLHAIEMMLCEYSKYWKMTIKEGKQRSKFVPHL